MRHRPLLLSVIVIPLAGLVLAGCGSSAAPAQPSPTQDAQALATELINEYAVAVFDRDQEALANLLSGAYVLRRSDGSGYDRQGYVDALAQGSDYELVNYEITNVKAQQDGDILVAEFTLEATILENGSPVTSEPSPSLVTFVRVDGQWKLASDAFFSR